MGCSGITPGGIRAFIEKWMKKEKLKPDTETCGLSQRLDRCVLILDNCANVTEAAVEEACGDLLKKESVALLDASSFGDFGEKNDHPCFTIDCPSTNRRLDIHLQFYSFISRNVEGPRFVTDNEADQDIDDSDDDEDDEDDDEDDDEYDDNEDDEDDEDEYEDDDHDEDRDDEDDEDSDIY
uniref:Uncharacterized protein n=1 Tax=Plectus sambesii TaxID=2011161 RepID=A0A914XU15_9BILA